MGGSSRIAAVLAHPRFSWAVAVLAVLLAAPSLGAGLQLDDYLHRLLVGWHRQGQGLGPWWDLYVAAEGDEALTRARMDLGFAPWWTVPDLRVRFFRPLSAATHYGEYALWPQAPALMHAHSLAWYAALVLAVGALLRRLLGPTWVAGLATLLFAVDEAHGTPIGWIAQRNALIGATLTVLAIWAHDRTRREGWRPGRVWGPVLLGLALLANEASVAALGWLLAHALWLDPAPRDSWSSRVSHGLRTLGPYVAVVVGWRLLYSAMGYGAVGSGVYLDPIAEPAAFAQALPDRIAVLWLAQLGGPSTDAWAGQLGAARVWAASATVVLGVVLARRLRAEPGLAVVLVGAVLALVPAAATVPDERSLLLVGVGGSAAVAGVIAVAVERGPKVVRGLAVLLSLPLVVVHLVLAPAALPARAGGLGARLDQPQRDAVASLPADPALSEQTLVIVNSPPTFVSSTLWLWRFGTERALPRRLRVLGSSFGPVVVQRESPRSLVLQPVGGYFGDPYTALARGRGHPFSAGDRIDLEGWSVQILAVEEARPTSVRIEFARPLEDPQFRWVTWTDGRFESLSLPPVGGVIALRPDSSSSD